MQPIRTIGHSNKPYELFLRKLKEHGIGVLVDTRSIPRSRFYPWFNEKALAKALPEAGIAYVNRSGSLGGKLENVGYDDAIEELVAGAVSGKRIAIMCSEGKYQVCHRHTMLEPSLRERGVRVEHIEY